MAGMEKVGFENLEAGYEFPEACVTLEAADVDTYLKAVGETSPLYRRKSLVPPTAVAARAMAALAECISLQPGTIHVSQELEFSAAVKVGDSITMHARVGRRQERSGMRLLAIELEVRCGPSAVVMRGRTSFILPAA
ncbi:MaoC family dehydratase N-terminal domain-containing protein [Chloroflexota bacterium]